MSIEQEAVAQDAAASAVPAEEQKQRKTCPECNGNGDVSCDECSGTGEGETCDACDGEGTVDDDTCDECNGQGAYDCEASDCGEAGDGRVVCGRCNGDGEITE